MKKIGTMVLLTMGYTGVLSWVFSTDFSRDNSFLVAPAPVQGKALGTPVMHEFAAATRLKSLSAEPSSQEMAAAHAVALDGQSPESAVDH